MVAKNGRTCVRRFLGIDLFLVFVFREPQGDICRDDAGGRSHGDPHKRAVARFGRNGEAARPGMKGENENKRGQKQYLQ